MITWIIEQLVMLVMKFLFSILVILAWIFVGNVSFANGAASLSPYIDTIFGIDSAIALSKSCFALATFLLIINFFIQIFRNIAEDDQNAPSPIRVAWNTGKHLFFAAMWFPLTESIMGAFGELYSWLIGASLGQGFARVMASGFAESFKALWSSLSGGAGLGNGQTLATDVVNGLAAILTGGATIMVVQCVLLIVLFFKITADFFKFLVDIVQRLVILSVFWIFGPLAFGVGNNVKWEDVPKLYVKTFISQLVAVVIYHFWALVIVNTMFKIGTNPNVSMWLGIMILMAVTQFGRSIDGYLGQIGLRTGNEGARMGDQFAAYAASGAKLGAMTGYNYASKGGMSGAFKAAREQGKGVLSSAASALAAPVSAGLAAATASNDTAQFLTAAIAQGNGKMSGLAQGLNREASQLRAQLSPWGVDKQYSARAAGKAAVQKAISKGTADNATPDAAASAAALANTDIDSYSVDTSGNSIVEGHDKMTGQAVAYSIDQDGNVSTTGKGIRPEISANSKHAIQSQKYLNSLPSQDDAQSGQAFKFTTSDGEGNSYQALGYKDSSGTPHQGVYNESTRQYSGIQFSTQASSQGSNNGVIYFQDDTGFLNFTTAGYASTPGETIAVGNVHSVAEELPTPTQDEHMVPMSNGTGAVYYNNTTNQPTRRVSFQKTDSITPGYNQSKVDSKNINGYSIVEDKFQNK